MNRLSSLKMIVHNSIGKILVECFGKHDTRKMKYKVTLCLIFKNEARFLKEWILYHQIIGVEHFYLYNNNSSDNYLDILEPFVKSGIITLHEWPYEQGQIKAYEHCYNNYRNETNWIGFIDADEFVCIKRNISLFDFLKQYDKYPSVCLYWHIFGSGGQLEHDDNRLVIEQYTSCWNELYSQGKNFFNTRFDIANWWLDCMYHWPMVYFGIGNIRITLHSINMYRWFTSPNYTFPHHRKNINKSEIKLNHYFCKAWDIYSKKIIKTDATYKNNPKKDLNYYYHFEENCTMRDYQIQKHIMRLKKSYYIQ